MLYMIFYYRLLGVVVVAGLAVTGAFLWAIIAIMGQAFNTTIDLAGVIGIIVSIGITVDSYIVYFERLKDEARSGRTIRTSVDRGFASAFRTVLAADAVSLLGAVVLYIFSVGPVKGFALFLGISTMLDVVVTYFFTRPFVILLGRSRSGSEAESMSVASGLGVTAGVSAVSPRDQRLRAGDPARVTTADGGRTRTERPRTRPPSSSRRRSTRSSSSQPRRRSARSGARSATTCFIRLYRGETSFDFIGNRRWWFGISAVIIVLGIISLGTRGLNEGIDFKGGQSWLVTSPTLTVAQATAAAEAAGVTQPTVVQLTNQINTASRSR